MATYIVQVPYTGYVTIEVEASSKSEAIEKALESDLCEAEVEEQEFCEEIVGGNVFYGCLNRATAELLE